MAHKKPEHASPYHNRLCELLEHKIAVFKDFMSATESLKDMIELHNVDAVEMIIARRHDYMSVIDRIDDEIRKIRKSNFPYTCPETRKRIDALTKTLESMIKKTLRLNQSCEKAAENELDLLRVDLSKVSNSRKWFKGYRGNDGEPRFLDVKT